MTVIASFITFVLGLVGMVHINWALGSSWPAKDELTLARAAVGTPNVRTMPMPGACVAAGTAILIAALLPQMLIGGALAGFLPDGLVVAMTVFATAVFLLRGLAGYSTPWRKRFPEEPFATFDRTYYSPLCLLIGAGFIVLLAGGLA